MNVLRLPLVAFTFIMSALQLTAAAHVQAQEVPPGTANTQALTELDPHRRPASRRIESPEHVILELRGGAYRIFPGEPYDTYFKSDLGPHLSVHADGILYREPKWFYVTLGGSFGWMRYTGKASNAETGETVGEETGMTVLPITASAGFRFDALARQLRIPFIFGVRVGWEWARWSTSTGARDDASGWSTGPVLSGQLALDLDTFEPGGARALDEEWGINHTYIFGEIYKFIPTSKSLDLGTTTWVAGLGFIF